MTIRTRMRNLAFAGIMAGALSAGCATTQGASIAAAPAPAQASAAHPRQETPAERCQRTQRTRMQNCLIESIVATCRESNSFNEDAFYSCVSENLVVPQSLEARPAKQYSVTVSAGDEVLSTRTGRAVAMDVARLEASQIDQRGVAFTYEIERITLAAPTERTGVDSATVRYNFDGTYEGEAFKLQGLAVWNLRVEGSGTGQARVSFESNDPALLVRPADAAAGAAPAQKRK